MTGGSLGLCSSAPFASQWTEATYWITSGMLIDVPLHSKMLNDVLWIHGCCQALRRRESVQKVLMAVRLMNGLLGHVWFSQTESEMIRPSRWHRVWTRVVSRNMDLKYRWTKLPAPGLFMIFELYWVLLEYMNTQPQINKNQTEKSISTDFFKNKLQNADFFCKSYSQILFFFLING